MYLGRNATLVMRILPIIILPVKKAKEKTHEILLMFAQRNQQQMKQKSTNVNLVQMVSEIYLIVSMLQRLNVECTMYNINMHKFYAQFADFVLRSFILQYKIYRIKTMSQDEPDILTGTGAPSAYCLFVTNSK